MVDFVLAFFRSSVGRKAVMGLTGIGALVYLFVHLAGNTLAFEGADTYNTYAKGLHSLPFLIVIELALLLVFLFHIGFGVMVTIQNWRARPIGYSQSRYRGIRSYASNNMIFSGLLILIYICLHLWDVRYGPGVQEMPTFERIRRVLTHWDSAGIYFVAFLALAAHLTYGIASSLQSLGLRYQSDDTWVEWLGGIVAWALVVSYASIPLWFLKVF